MQQTLKITYKNDEIISKPFDFEAMCIIDDAFNSNVNGKLNYSKNAVLYMFEGTKASKDVLNGLPLEEHAYLCQQVWDFYLQAWDKVPKKK